MHKKQPNIETHEGLVDKISELFESRLEINFINLCTVDGFSIKTLNRSGQNIDEDKLAAVSSTISSMSDGTAKQLLDGVFSAAIVESNAGNIFVTKTIYQGADCVLSVAATQQMLLGEVRFLTARLSREISKLNAPIV